MLLFKEMFTFCSKGCVQDILRKTSKTNHKRNHVCYGKQSLDTHNNIDTNKLITNNQSINDVARRDSFCFSQGQLFGEKIASLSSDELKDFTPTNKIQQIIKVTDETPIRQQMRHRKKNNYVYNKKT